jgi:hypothetical protein
VSYNNGQWDIPSWAGSFVKATGGSTASFVLTNPTDGTDEFALNRIIGATQLQIYGKADGTADAIVGLIAPNGTDYADYTYNGADADLDVSAGGLNLRPLSSGANVQVWSPAGTVKLRIGSQNFTQALDISHDGTNAHLTPTTGYVGFQSDTFQILPTGAVNYVGPTTAAAAAGTNGAPPSEVGGYMAWQIGGTTVHLPYYL